MATGRVPTTANSPLTAKGDVFTYSTAPARLAVGSDGDTLVADSAATTGLRWQGNYSAGKNKIINGDFRINQRAFTSNTTDASYNFDRWQQFNGGTTGTLTITPQTFTLGSAPVSGYEGSTFIQCVTASGASANTYAQLQQKIESVRTFANQTVTVSFWAKAASGTPKVSVEFQQMFGTGGSPSSTVITDASFVTISTSWARYSLTVTIPSISGKTLGTTANTDYLGLVFWLSAGSDFNSRTTSMGLQNATIQFWGVQVEAGSVATAFQTATGTLQGELAACQRYYYRLSGDGVYTAFGHGYAYSTTGAAFFIPLPVTMRVKPSSLDYANLGASLETISTTAITTLAFSTASVSPYVGAVNGTVASGLTQYRPYSLTSNNSASGYVGFSAEL